MTTANDAFTSPSLEKPAARLSWLERGFLLAVILGCAVAMSPNQADPDLWGHVTYGLDALRDGIAQTTTYSYTAEGYRWINHENIAEVVLAVTAVSFGPVGLLVLKCLLGVAIIGMIAGWARRERVDLLPLSVVLIVVALNMAYRWAVRPQIFTYFYFAALMLLVNWAFSGWAGRWHLPWLRKFARDERHHASPQREGESEKNTADDLGYCSWRMRWLWLAPFLFLLWANTHGGFVAGLCIYTAILGLRAGEALCVRGRRGWGLVRRMALMIAVAWLATFINPYGPNLHAWLLGSLGTPRPEISEWASLHLGSKPFIPFVILAALMLGALSLSRRPLDFTHMAILAITTWQGISHERHIAFLAILFGFWMPAHVASLLVRLKISDPGASLTGSMSPASRRFVVAGLLLSYVLLAARLYQRLGDIPVEKDKYPVAAMQYIARHDLTGKLVVTFNWAQYAIAALGPSSPEADDGLRVAFDGRFRTCYPQEVVDMHFDLILGDGPQGTRYRSARSGPVDGRAALEFGRPDVVLLNRKQWHSVDVMEQHRDDWVLLYQDAVAQVWGRRDVFDDRSSGQFIPLAQRHVSDEPQQGSVTWPALPPRSTPGVLARAQASRSATDL